MGVSAGSSEHDGLRRWAVAGGVLEEDGRYLLVQNQRRNGDLDWSTPGGVIDPGEVALEALTREVVEETGIHVHEWSTPLYRVEVTAPGFGFHLEVVAHRAVTFSGDIEIDDPDGIVVAAEFLEIGSVVERLDGAPPWVAEPLLEHLMDGVTDDRLYSYELLGSSAADRKVVRL